MFPLTNKPEMGARLYSRVVELSTDPRKGIDAMKVIQHMAGVLVETLLVFEKPEAAIPGSFCKLSDMLGCEPLPGPLKQGALPPAHLIDFETERGRYIARTFFEDWMDCAFELHELVLVVTHNALISWEEFGQPRAESFRLFIECVKRCMAFEIAAQELCDVVIERKVADEGWGLSECVASLSASAGRRLAMSLDTNTCELFRGCDMPDPLDRVVYVMTQEAVRLGVPAGSDWRFGLAANDVPVNAPIDLVLGIEPYCQSFFRAIKMFDQYEQSVCCAKAAGRMLAVAAGGELPELEPVIAKPLAMAAIAETYKSVCLDQAVFS